MSFVQGPEVLAYFLGAAGRTFPEVDLGVVSVLDALWLSLPSLNGVQERASLTQPRYHNHGVGDATDMNGAKVRSPETIRGPRGGGSRDTRDLFAAEGPPRKARSIGPRPTPVERQFIHPRQPPVDVRSFARSLQYFGKQHHARGRLTLDVDATLRQTAAAGGSVMPVFARAVRPTISASLLLDQSASMAPWSSTISAIREAFLWSGAFSSVETQLFDTSSAKAVSVGPPSARHLFLIISDFRDPSWSEPARWSCIRAWADEVSVALLNPLPERWWGRSVLPRTAVRVFPSSRFGVSAKLPFHVNVHDDYGPLLGDTAGIPVLGLDPEKMSAWARTIGAGMAASCPGILLSGTAHVRKLRAVKAPTALDGFRRLASSSAWRLAVRATVSDLHSVGSLQVLAGDGPDAAADIAQLLASGFVALNGRSIEIDPAVRERLRPLLSAQDAFDVYQAFRAAARTTVVGSTAIPVLRAAMHGDTVDTADLVAYLHVRHEASSLIRSLIPAEGVSGPSQEAWSPRSSDSRTPVADPDVSGRDSSPSWRMRNVLARIQDDRKLRPDMKDALLEILLANHAAADVLVVERAYHTAEIYHSGRFRKSGEPYIAQPLAVATILAELGMTEASLCAALLYEAVENSSYTKTQLTADFGLEITTLVDEVIKLDKVADGDPAKAETLRNIVLAMSRDTRVLVIKLAGRLYTMRTLGFWSQDEQPVIARETLEIYSPLAHRLGLYAIKWELEDLAFATLHPKVYDEIVRMVAASAPMRENYLRIVIEQVKEDLSLANIKATVYGQPKHYYAIYREMVVRGLDFFEVYDLYGLRILVEAWRDCYEALGVLHARWSPLPGRFKDYIAMPKFNLYRSLHTTVLGPDSKPVDFRIRTHEMHRQARNSIPSTSDGGSDDDADDSTPGWEISDWENEIDEVANFPEVPRLEINTSNVFVFTPEGDVISLPAGSTPVDFAYSMDTEVGNRAVAARVDKLEVPLDYRLRNGDEVEVLTSTLPSYGPSADWLGFVASPRARSKIRQYLERERGEALTDSDEEGPDDARGSHERD